MHKAFKELWADKDSRIGQPPAEALRRSRLRRLPKGSCEFKPSKYLTRWGRARAEFGPSQWKLSRLEANDSCWLDELEFYFTIYFELGFHLLTQGLGRALELPPTDELLINGGPREAQELNGLPTSTMLPLTMHAIFKHYKTYCLFMISCSQGS